MNGNYLAIDIYEGLVPLYEDWFDVLLYSPAQGMRQLPQQTTRYLQLCTYYNLHSLPTTTYYYPLLPTTYNLLLMTLLATTTLRSSLIFLAGIPKFNFVLRPVVVVPEEIDEDYERAVRDFSPSLSGYGQHPLTLL